MLLCVREQAATDGPPAFIGIMRTLATSEQHLVMLHDFTITAASQGSLVLLNVDATTLLSGGMNIEDWVEEWPVCMPCRLVKVASIITASTVILYAIAGRIGRTEAAKGVHNKHQSGARQADETSGYG
jgi:hypothetical protein